MRTDRYLFLAIVLVFLLVSISSGEKVDLSPKEVVLNWTQVYGKDLLKAAYLTTLNFRNDQSEEDWAFRYSNIIRQIKYEHLGREIIDELTKEDKSLIVLQAKIMTAAGGMKQKELYHLRKVDGLWLIDEITIKEEEEFGKSTELNDDA